MITATDKSMGGYLKISLINLEFIDKQKLKEKETIIQIKVSMNNEQPKVSRPIIAKWETKNSLKEKHMKIYQGLDSLLWKDKKSSKSIQEYIVPQQEAHEDEEEPNLFVYLGDNSFVFDCHEQDEVRFEIFKKNTGNDQINSVSKLIGVNAVEEKIEKISQCYFPVSKIVHLEKILHQMQIYLIDSAMAKIKMIKQVAVLDLQIVYLSRDIGTLELRIIEAKISSQKAQQITGILTSLNPYLIIQTKKQKIQTKIDRKGGQHPIWNETFEIKIQSLEKQIEMVLYNDNIGSNLLIGSITMDMVNEDILKYTKSKHTKTVSLKDPQGKDIGSLKFQTKFRINIS